MPEDVNPDTNFKVIDKRSPETRARKAEMADHFGDVTEMVLKPCPFCGGEAFSTNVYDFEVRLNRNTSAFSSPDLHRISCPRCRCASVTACGEGDAEYAKRYAEVLWNRRTPEPGTSVITWHRYDGTP